MLLLMCALLVPDTPVSLFGVGGEVRKLREMLLIIAATVPAMRMFDLNVGTVLREIMETYIRKIASGNDDFLLVLRLRFGLGGAQVIPKFEFAELTARNIVAFLLAGLSFILWILLSVFGVVLIHIATIISILWHPSPYYSAH